MSLAVRRQRMDVLSSRVANADRLDPLVFSAAIPEKEFQAVKSAAFVYLSRCLGGDRLITDEDELIAKMAENYTRIGNLTPNGKVMPKPWLNLEYNLFLRELARAIKTLGLDEEIEDYRLPTLRYKPPMAVSNPQFASRPYATEKPHNEMWISSKNCDSIVMHLLIFGDSDHNHVRFYQTPPSYDEKWMRPIKDFVEVADVLELYKPIEKKPQKGRFYMFEGTAVHSTHITPDAGGRISVEMFAVMKNKVPNIHLQKDDRLMDFTVKPEVFHKLGDGLFLGVKDTMSGVVEKENLVTL
ncbi:MAG: hypothetical protein V4760_18700 [Bdellovibrionota bacterium]